MKGKLIVIEGLDGSGKATQTSLLYKYLKNKNEKVLTVSFPDYKQTSSALVKMYLNSEFGNDPDTVNAYAAASFYSVDRYASFIKFWKDKYKSGFTIIADRYTTSNAIYQMSKLEPKNWDEYLNWLYDYEYEKLLLPKPNLVIYLDMPIEISQELMSIRYKGNDKKKDIHESNLPFLKTCRETALYSSKKWGWKEIRCFNGLNSKSVDEIHREIVEIINEVNFLRC